MSALQVGIALCAVSFAFVLGFFLGHRIGVQDAVAEFNERDPWDSK